MANKTTYAYLKKERAIPCPSGERLKDKNILDPAAKGNNLKLKKVGVVDTVEQIQSYLDGVALDRMIERFKRGDTSALENQRGFYADVSGYAEDLQTTINNGRAVVDFAAKQAAAAEPPAKPTATEPLAGPTATEPQKGE